MKNKIALIILIIILFSCSVSAIILFEDDMEHSPPIIPTGNGWTFIESAGGAGSLNYVDWNAYAGNKSLMANHTGSDYIFSIAVNNTYTEDNITLEARWRYASNSNYLTLGGTKGSGNRYEHIRNNGGTLTYSCGGSWIASNQTIIPNTYYLNKLTYNTSGYYWWHEDIFIMHCNATNFANPLDGFAMRTGLGDAPNYNFLDDVKICDSFNCSVGVAAAPSGNNISFSNAKNKSIVRQNEDQQMNITITSEGGADIDCYIFSWNISTSWKNDTCVNAGASPYSASITRSVLTNATDKTYGWRFYANSTTDNTMNSSAIYTFEIATPQSLKINATNFFNNSKINTFEILVFNSTYSNHLTTTIGLINTGLTDQNNQYSVSIWSDVNFNSTYNLLNSSQGIVTLNLQQSVLNVTARTKVNNTIIKSFSTTIAQLSNSTTSGSIIYYPNAGDHSINATSSGYHQLQKNITVSALDNRTLQLELFNRNLTIVARDFETNATIYNFTSVLSNLTFGYSEALISTEQNNQANGSRFDIINGYYNLYVDAPGYQQTNFNVSVNNTVSSWSFAARLLRENIFNITFYDEITRNVLDSNTIQAEFIVYGVDAKTYYTTNGSMSVPVIQQGVEHLIRYMDLEGVYSERFYYITHINRTYMSLDLYLASFENDTNVDATVYDYANDPVEEATIKVLRYDINCNCWTISEIKKTNFAGEARLRLILDEEFYKFIIEYQEEVYLETAPTPITETTITFNINLREDVTEDYYKSEGLIHDLSFDASNNSYRLFWNDPSNSMDNVCLKVYRIIGNSSNTLYTSVCSTSVAGVVYAAPNNITGATYRADVFVVYTQDELIVNSLWYEYSAELIFGMDGWIYTIIIMILMIFALMSVSLSLVPLAIPLSLILTKFINFHDIHWGVITGLTALALTISYIIHSRN